jgi:Family of unknown function (DUF6988)
MSVEEELKKAEYTIEEVKKILNGLKLSGDAWSIVAAGMIHQGIEHHEAILSLIRSKFVGSAFALVRSVVEILVRGAWFTCCATKEQVTKFIQQDKIDLTFGEMSDAIDQSQGIDFFHDFKERTWKMLNSYTHTGILQLGRRWTGDKLAASYKEGEIIEVLRACTTCILLLVQPYLAKNGHADEDVRVLVDCSDSRCSAL